MPARLIVTAAAVGMLVFAGAVAVDAGIQEAGQKFVVNDESFDTALDQVTQLEQSELDVRYFYGSNITVLNGSSVQMVEGEDYEWIRDNGTIRVLSSRLADDPSGTITYGYTVTSSELQNVSEGIGSGLRAATLLVFVVTVGFVVAGARALGLV